MIKTYYKKIKDDTFKEKTEIKSGSWINVTYAKEEDIKRLTELTNLNYEDLVDALDELEVPRIERQKDNVLLFARVPSYSDNELYTDTFTLILTPDYLITISLKESSLTQSIIKNGIDIATTQKSKLLIAILLKIAFLFTRKIKNFRAEVLSKKRRIQKISDKDIIKMTENEEILSQYLSALIPLRNVIETILRGDYIKLYEEDNELFQDLYINIKQSVDVCTVNLKSIQNLRDSYQIIFTNYVNRELKLLTTLTIMLTIPTIVFSFYGMNVSLPFDNNPNAFLIVTGVVIFSTLFLISLFKYKKWF